MTGKGGAIAALIGVPIALVGLLFGFVLVLGSANPAAACSPGAAIALVDPGAVPAGPVAGYGHDQLVNAAAIEVAAAGQGLDAHGAQIGIAAAMGESGLEVLDHGDTVGPDSRGLFQQRDSWGPLATRMDPAASAALFFTHLVAVPGWESLEPTLAIHRVQGNADPYHYARYWAPAGEVLAALTGSSSAEPASGNCASGVIGLPLVGPYTMTSGYGARLAPTEGASSFHPAVDLQNQPNPCGRPIYAILPGTVVLSNRLSLSVKSPDGYTVSYLHSHLEDRRVRIGDPVTTGEQISAVGNEAPATGCHLDLRINVIGSTDSRMTALPVDPRAPGWVDPEDFYAALGGTLCDTRCHRNIP